MDRVGRASLAQGRAELGLAHKARDPGQGAQVLRVGLRRREQRHQQVHGLVIKRVEGDGRIQAHHDGADPIQTVQPRVRQGDAFADPGGAGGFRSTRPARA